MSYGGSNGYHGGYGGYPPAPHYDGYGYPAVPPPPPHPSAYGAPVPPPPGMYGYPPAYPHYPPPPMSHALDEFRPPPEAAVDQNVFRQFFMQQLEYLKFNSKPAITNMTLFANEHQARMSGVVASCLEDHIKNCPPEYKLPALYLLDSISKNIGPPYIALFCRFIERIFLSAYHSVDRNTQIKLEELLGTWRSGGPDGGELFRTPEEGRRGRVQRGIESALFGRHKGEAAKTTDSSGHGQEANGMATPGERSGVLFDIRRLLQKRADELAVRPVDVVIREQMSALEKLETLVVNTQLTSEQVKQIRAQLAALAPREVKQESPVPEGSAFGTGAVPLFSQSEIPSARSVPPANPAPVNVAQGIDLGLLASLQASGGLSGLLASAQHLRSRDSASPAPPAALPALLEQSDDPLAEHYDRAILDFDIRLNNAEFTRWRPDAAGFLYGRLGLQCKQCGLRFFDSSRGKRYMDEHLDWHFTHKRRIREGAGRAQGRSWLLLEEDWIHADDADVIGSGKAEEGEATDAAKTGSGKISRAELLKQKVTAPTDPARLARPCPICKEKFKAEWSESDEEWVFYNCVDVGGTLFHAICHAEASSATKVAGRLREGDSARTSREHTPLSVKEELSPVGGPDSAAKKRKADDASGFDLDLKRPKSEF